MVATKRKTRVISKRQLVKLIPLVAAYPKSASARKFIRMARTHPPRVVFEAAASRWSDGWTCKAIGITEFGNHSFSKFNRAALAYCRKHGIK